MRARVVNNVMSCYGMVSNSVFFKDSPNTHTLSAAMTNASPRQYRFRLHLYPNLVIVWFTDGVPRAREPRSNRIRHGVCLSKL